MTTPLDDLDSVCDDIFERWDKDMRSGKLLRALCGALKNYDPRVTRIRAALSPPNEAASSNKPPLKIIAANIQHQMRTMYPVDHLGHVDICLNRPEWDQVIAALCKVEGKDDGSET